MHSLDTVDLLLKGNRNCGLDYLCIRANVIARDRNLWWRKNREERNGQCGNNRGSRENNQQGADSSEYWPANKEIYHAGILLLSGLSVHGPEFANLYYLRLCPLSGVKLQSKGTA